MKPIEIRLFKEGFSASTIFSCKYVCGSVGKRTNISNPQTPMAILTVYFSNDCEISVVGDGEFVDEVKNLKQFVPDDNDDDENVFLSFKSKALKVILHSLNDDTTVELIENIYAQGLKEGREKMKCEFREFIGAARR